jgi:hypothetical protein
VTPFPTAKPALQMPSESSHSLQSTVLGLGAFDTVTGGGEAVIDINGHNLWQARPFDTVTGGGKAVIDIAIQNLRQATVGSEWQQGLRPLFLSLCLSRSAGSDLHTPPSFSLLSVPVRAPLSSPCLAYEAAERQKETEQLEAIQT